MANYNDRQTLEAELERAERDRRRLNYEAEEKRTVAAEKKKLKEDISEIKRLEKEVHPTKLQKVEHGLVTGGKLFAKALREHREARERRLRHLKEAS